MTRLRGEKKLLYVSIMFFGASVLSFSLIPSLAAATDNETAQDNAYVPCKCVIFRLDDVADYGNNQVQSSIMDHFIIENKKLIIAIIVNDFGNLGADGIVYAKVKEGYDKGVFDLAIHGWDHVKYSNLTEGQQFDTFMEANNKLQTLLSNKSKIFIPPFNEFNSDTVKAMGRSGLDIFSTSYQNEAETPNPYKVTIRYVTNNSKIQLSEVNFNSPNSSQTQPELIYHVPFDISLLDLIRQGYSGENLTQKVLTNVNKDIAKYGFSVITLHPTDFAAFDSSSGKYTNSVDPFKFQVLANIIDSLLDQGISISDFSHVTKTAVLPNC